MKLINLYKLFSAEKFFSVYEKVNIFSTIISL